MLFFGRDGARPSLIAFILSFAVYGLKIVLLHHSPMWQTLSRQARPFHARNLVAPHQGGSSAFQQNKEIMPYSPRKVKREFEKMRF